MSAGKKCLKDKSLIDQIVKTLYNYKNIGIQVLMIFNANFEDSISLFDV